MKSKVCTKCGIDKPLERFHKDRLGKYGLHSQCKDCMAKYRRQNRDRLRKQDRERQIKKLYGMTMNEHDELLTKQNGVCLGCGATNFNGKSYHLAVDHNHETGEVRGLLCLKCNRILGLANDSPSILRALADYLENSEVAEVGSQTLKTDVERA